MQAILKLDNVQNVHKQQESCSLQVLEKSVLTYLSAVMVNLKKKSRKEKKSPSNVTFRKNESICLK